jgi:hypothetical protein
VFKDGFTLDASLVKATDSYAKVERTCGKRAVENHFHPLPTGLNEESQLEPEPEEALETRRNASREGEVLVTGKGFPCFENSWKLAERMSKEFPGFLLEVKESFKGGGIDSYAKVERTCGKRAVENHFLIWKTHDLYRWKREKGNMSTI